jgi:hypothetical protein
MLLRFRVANHRSIRDEATLSMVSPALQTVTPPDGDWVSSTTRVAGIYGPNASGKSNILSAIDFAATAVGLSATSWAERNTFPHNPYRLDDKHPGLPSFYEFSVVVEGVRHDYGFTSDAAGIRSEWLYSYPQGRKRKTFVRESADTASISFARGPAYAGHAALLPFVNSRTLVLSVAANASHRYLAPIHNHISREIRYARFTEFDRTTRLRAVREDLARPGATEIATRMLRLADVGITGVSVRDRDIPADLRTLIDALGDKVSLDIDKQILEFFHASGEGPAVGLPENDQSSGTLAWLTLALPAVWTLGLGGVLLIDEIDASLHPFLSATLVNMFKNPALNRSGAQLVFTTHDTALLRRSPEALEPAEVWFVEKKSGSTELYSLAEFPTRPDQNFANRYLDGRYGAVPIIVDEFPELSRTNVAS